MSDVMHAPAMAVLDPLGLGVVVYNKTSVAVNKFVELTVGEGEDKIWLPVNRFFGIVMQLPSLHFGQPPNALDLYHNIMPEEMDAQPPTVEKHYRSCHPRLIPKEPRPFEGAGLGGRVMREMYAITEPYFTLDAIVAYVNSERMPEYPALTA